MYIPGSAWLSPFSWSSLRYRWWINYVEMVDAHIEAVKEANKHASKH